MASSKPRTASGTSQSGRVSPVDGSLGEGVGVATGAGTAVGVGVGVGVAVGVGMGVGVAVPVSAVGVGVGVGVAVAGRGIGVDVGSRLVLDVPPPPVLGRGVAVAVGAAVGRGLTVGVPTVTREAPPTAWSFLSKSLRSPEKVWRPFVLDAVTVYVKEASPCKVNLTSWPVTWTFASGRLLDS